MTAPILPHSLMKGSRLWQGKRLRIGILGGSFNPAHAGHFHISVEALKRAKLDHIWWMVTPQNPLKTSDETLPLDKRIAEAKACIKNHPRIHILSWHRDYRTIDTIGYLQQTFPLIEFVWIMGDDNLQQFHRWYQWKKIAEHIPMLVMARTPNIHPILHSKAALTLRATKTPHSSSVFEMSNTEKPQKFWSFIPIRKSILSSTEIRKHWRYPIV